jgi:DNA-binding response OmpR family regulator
MSLPVILLVDADTTVHDLANEVLGNEGAVLGARTAPLALRMAGKRSPAVVVIDDELTESTPEKFLADLRDVSPMVRAALLTRSREPQHTARLSTLGPVLVKPLDGDRLLVVVRSLLRLRSMAEGVERMKTGEFPPVSDRSRIPTRRVRPEPGRSRPPKSAKPSGDDEN